MSSHTFLRFLLLFELKYDNMTENMFEYSLEDVNENQL